MDVIKTKCIFYNNYPNIKWMYAIRLSYQLHSVLHTAYFTDPEPSSKLCINHWWRNRWMVREIVDLSTLINSFSKSAKVNAQSKFNMAFKTSIRLEVGLLFLFSRIFNILSFIYFLMCFKWLTFERLCLTLFQIQKEHPYKYHIFVNMEVRHIEIVALKITIYEQ